MLRNANGLRCHGAACRTPSWVVFDIFDRILFEPTQKQSPVRRRHPACLFLPATSSTDAYNSSPNTFADVTSLSVTSCSLYAPSNVHNAQSVSNMEQFPVDSVRSLSRSACSIDRKAEARAQSGHRSHHVTGIPRGTACYDTIFLHSSSSLLVGECDLGNTYLLTLKRNKFSFADLIPSGLDFGNKVVAGCHTVGYRYLFASFCHQSERFVKQKLRPSIFMFKCCRNRNVFYSIHPSAPGNPCTLARYTFSPVCSSGVKFIRIKCLLECLARIGLCFTPPRGAEW